MDFKQLRRKYRYNQVQLAEALGIGQSSVAGWEAGACMPSTENLYKMSKLFRVSMNTIYEALKQDLSGK